MFSSIVSILRPSFFLFLFYLLNSIVSNTILSFIPSILSLLRVSNYSIVISLVVEALYNSPPIVLFISILYLTFKDNSFLYIITRRLRGVIYYYYYSGIFPVLDSASLFKGYIGNFSIYLSLIRAVKLLYKLFSIKARPNFNIIDKD